MKAAELHINKANEMRCCNSDSIPYQIRFRCSLCIQFFKFNLYELKEIITINIDRFDLLRKDFFGNNRE